MQPSQAKNRLFVGGLPTDLTSEALRAAVELVAVGLQKADVMRNREHPEQGRGFAFLEYYNAACAALAKAALSSPGFRIGDKPLSVDFAEPSAREAAAAGGGVKVVFVGNLTEEATEEGLNAAMAKYGAVRPPPGARGSSLRPASSVSGLHEQLGAADASMYLPANVTRCSLPACPHRLSACTSRAPARAAPTRALGL